MEIKSNKNNMATPFMTLFTTYLACPLKARCKTCAVRIGEIAVGGIKITVSGKAKYEKTGTITYKMKTIILLLAFLTVVGCGMAQQKAQKVMSRIEFIPEEFHDVELGFRTPPNPCTPYYPDVSDKPVNSIAINVPQKIIYHIPEDKTDSLDIEPVIPVCINLRISEKRALKYHQMKDSFHIRKLGEDDWHSGLVEEIHEDHIILPPNWEKDKKRAQREIAKAQNIPDEELDGGTSYGEVMNHNVYDFVDIPVSPGKYEIYFSANGLKSNRMVVEIEFNDDEGGKTVMEKGFYSKRGNPCTGTYE